MMFRAPSQKRTPLHLVSRGWALLLVGFGVGLGGCQMQMGMLSSTPLTTTKFTLEQTDKLVLQDPWVQRTISSTGIQHSVRPDGKMQIVVNIKNRESGLNRVELSIAFKSTDGLVDLEQTPWKVLELEGRVTQAVRFVSAGTTARNFAVRVRQAIP